MCGMGNLLEVHMYLNEYNKVKSSTVTVGIIKVHPVMKKLRRRQSNQ